MEPTLCTVQSIIYTLSIVVQSIALAVQTGREQSKGMARYGFQGGGIFLVSMGIRPKSGIADEDELPQSERRHEEERPNS